MSDRPENRVFGKRAKQHLIIVASGDRIRHMTVHPWMAALGFCFVGVFAIGYLAATSYLVLRDDLIGATMARQARMQHDYEDRITAHRAQVDRVTSRQLLDQQVVEQKVEKLLEQQMALSSRHGKLDSLLTRAENSGVQETDIPVPAIAPETDDRRADASGGLRAIEQLMGLKTAGAASTGVTDRAALAYVSPRPDSMADRADRLFSRVTISLKGIEQQQVARIQSLTANAAETAEAIHSIVRRTGIAMDDTAGNDDTSAMGGPFVEPEPDGDFDVSLTELDTALERLERARGAVRKLPFDNPSPGSDITSRYGNRVDPFLGRLALHAGIDFRVSVGTDIHATGAGTVTVAGRNGGYGIMVEIDHGNGITTRYAHMSQVLVNVGDQVDGGDRIGRSGSTGRSTGPHLHYEVRREGKAVDPMRFLSAGLKLTSYMN